MLRPPTFHLQQQSLICAEKRAFKAETGRQKSNRGAAEGLIQCSSQVSQEAASVIPLP